MEVSHSYVHLVITFVFFFFSVSKLNNEQALLFVEKCEKWILFSKLKKVSFKRNQLKTVNILF